MLTTTLESILSSTLYLTLTHHTLSLPLKAPSMFDRTHPVGVGLQQTSFKIVAYLFITFLLEDVTYLCDNLLTLSYGFEQQ